MLLFAKSYQDLLGKRRAFVDATIGEAHCCKAEAAALAGYRHPNQEGYRLCKDPDIRDAIEEWLKGLAMGAQEILRRLEQQAAGDLGEFITVEVNGEFGIDRTAAKRAGKLRLIKKAGFDQKGRPAIELYNAQAALVALSKRFIPPSPASGSRPTAARPSTRSSTAGSGFANT